MSSTAIVASVVAGLVVLAVVAVVTAAHGADGRRAAGVLSRETRRRDRSNVPAGAPPVTHTVIEGVARAIEPVAAKLPALFVPPDAETVAFTRRQFFNRSTVTLMSLGLGAFGAASLAFLWPTLSGGFGAKIHAGKLDDLKGQIRTNRNALYLAAARGWLVEYPAEAVPKAAAVYRGAVLTGMHAGIVALYQRCPHLGCRVPFCETSQWFECPCHGSQYNRVGEKKGGPAPRGMDRFAVTITGGDLTIDTSQISLGPPIGTNTTGQETEGPHCVTSVGAHPG